MRIVILLTASLLPLPALADAPPDAAIWQYKVQAGDTVWSIASRHLLSADYIPQLRTDNRIANPRRLRPGSVLSIPYAWVKQHAAAAVLDAQAGPVSISGSHGEALSVTLGQRYASGTRFHTGRDAMLRLRFEDGSQLILNANSTLTLEQQAYFTSTGAILTQNRLDQGSAGSSVIPNLLMPSRYRIQTPSAVTTVRGTVFRVRSVAADDTATEVLRGKVNVNAQQGEVDVPAGFGSRGQAQGGRPIVLPPAPALTGLAARAEFNPPLLRWQAGAGETGYHLALSRADGENEQLQERETDAPRFAPLLPGNGGYRLAIRAINADGLQGFDSERPLQLHAYPLPPLLLNGPPAQQQRGEGLLLRSGASVAHPARVQIARDAAFQQRVFDGELTQAEWRTRLPGPGTWYWRAASIAPDGASGPYSDIQRVTVTGWLGVPDIQPAMLCSRRYPIDAAHYTLRLESASGAYEWPAPQPCWRLRDLPRGQFAVTIRIDGEHGYHAVENHPPITLP
ncbi:FecR domain-containing protein [Chromobacterium paludis]|uniref:LysM peptidoglycan-binding domain-containing protein n=1 Tax=Chromobacterium paludis TaxID=2605945 RepID=A0A5C1DGU7_9NEIS|nr:FecR domain-containing protein [Chromobacterium paludis]QEL55916.1 LysM peptidoglycan-binding domain-containing protein [Chromobacterium paludis]